MGDWSPQNKIRAAPPMVEKTGAPRIVAISSATSAGRTSFSGAIGECTKNSMIAPANNRAAPRPFQ